MSDEKLMVVIKKELVFWLRFGRRFLAYLFEIVIMFLVEAKENNPDDVKLLDNLIRKTNSLLLDVNAGKTNAQTTVQIITPCKLDIPEP